MPKELAKKKREWNSRIKNRNNWDEIREKEDEMKFANQIQESKRPATRETQILTSVRDEGHLNLF